MSWFLAIYLGIIGLFCWSVRGAFRRLDVWFKHRHAVIDRVSAEARRRINQDPYDRSWKDLYAALDAVPDGAGAGWFTRRPCNDYYRGTLIEAGGLLPEDR